MESSNSNAYKLFVHIKERSKGKCSYYVSGWWTYEVCTGKHVRQFHAENKRILKEFYLGKEYNEDIRYDVSELGVKLVTEAGGNQDLFWLFFAL